MVENVVLLGDCVEVMATLEPESVDAIVTDPPYELGEPRSGSDTVSGRCFAPRSEATKARRRTGFMGKAWDGTGVAFRPETWAAALRVAKPGAHLLAFGGTRTYHRLTCAIEDAGWEIRDCLVYAYASGFPKSLNLDRSEAFCRCDRALSPTKHYVRSMPEPDVPEAVDAPSGQGTLLLETVPEPSPRLRGDVGPGAAATEAALRAGQPGVEGRGDVLQAPRELSGSPVRAGAGVGAADGPQGRLHHGAPAGDGSVGGPAPDANGDGQPRQPRPVRQSAGEPGPLADERGPQAWRGWPSCPRCGKSQIPPGLGTALKPAWEPIVMARKPLTGTVAANVERWGTGALNIDGTRIGTGGDKGEWPITGRDVTQVAYGEFAGPTLTDNSRGRWPANVLLTDPIFDGDTPGVVGGGETVSGKMLPTVVASGERTVFGQDADAGYTTIETYGDSGTYSRFFLIPKAARSDREPVLGGLPAGFAPTMGNGIGGREHDPADRRAYRANVHPTVKPTDLMRHLVRLVTPPGGLVLDPFLGSGTTAIAAELEGFRWLGIEQDASYVAIAEARLNGTQRGLGLDSPAPTPVWKDYPTATRYPVKGPSPSSWFTESARGAAVEESPAIDGIDLELFPGMAGAAESDEVA